MTERVPWLTEKEAAKELRVSAYTVRQEREAGRLGYAKIRSRFFYPMSQINDYKARAMRPAKTNSDSADSARPAAISASDHAATNRAREMVKKLRSTGKLPS